MSDVLTVITKQEGTQDLVQKDFKLPLIKKSKNGDDFLRINKDLSYIEIKTECYEVISVEYNVDVTSNLGCEILKLIESYPYQSGEIQWNEVAAQFKGKIE